MTRTAKQGPAAAEVDAAVVAQATGALDAAVASLGLEGDVDPAAVVESVDAARPAVDGTWVVVPLTGPVRGRVVALLGEPVVADLVDGDGEAPVLLGALGSVVDALGATPGDVDSGDGFDGAELAAATAAATATAVGLRQDGERVLTLLVLLEPSGAPAPAVFPSLDPPASPTAGLPAIPATPDPVALTLIRGVEMQVTAELGRTTMTVRELLQLGPGSVIELDRAAGSPVDLLVNGTLIARGEVVVIDEEYGIRVSQIVNPAEER